LNWLQCHVHVHAYVHASLSDCCTIPSQELLLQAQQRGVQVTFLYDSYGSLTLWRMVVNLHRLVSPVLFEWYV